MQPTTSADALSQLQTTEQGAQDPNSILQAQNQALGVNGAQQTVTGLRGAINNTTKLLQQVAPSVMGRTAGSLVTNAQASKQVQNEQAPISANLTQEGTDYNNANSDLQQLEGQAQTAANGIYQGQQDKLSYAQNLYNSLYGQEKDAAAAAEQKREFDAQQATADAASALANRQFNLGQQTTTDANNKTTADAATQQKQSALSDVQSVIRNNNPQQLLQYITAVTKSANYGNTTDKMKLEALQSALPGDFINGQLNTKRLNSLIQQASNPNTFQIS